MLALLGPWDFVIIAAVVVFVFGTKPFRRMFRSLKSGGKEFKRGITGKDKQQLPPPPSEPSA